MRVVDANVLLYAVNPDARLHSRSQAWLDDALESDEAVGFAWSALLTFVRVGTSRAVFAQPLAVAEAVQVVELWLAQPAAVIIHPTSRHLPLLLGLLADSGTAGDMVNDAHLAALALEHGAEIVSFDRDFQRFAGLRSFVP